MAIAHYIALLAIIVAGIFYHLYSTQVEDRKSIIKKFEQQSKQTKQDVESIKQQLVEAQEKIKVSDSELQSHKDAYELIIKRFNLSNDVLSKENKDYEVDHEKLVSEINDLKLQINQFEQKELLNGYEVVDKVKEVEEEEDQGESLSELKERLEREYEYKLNSHIERLITEKDLIIANQQTEMEGIEVKFKNDIELLTSDGSKLERSIKRLENELLERNKIIDEKDNKVSELEATNKLLSVENDNFIIQIKESDELLFKKAEELEEQLVKKKKQAEKARLETLSCKETIEEQAGNVARLENEVENLKQEATKDKLSIEKLTTEFNNKQKEIDELNKQYAVDLDVLKNNHEGELLNKDNQITAEQEKYQTLESKLQETIKSHESAIEAKDKNISDIEDKLTKLKEFYNDKQFTPEIFNEKIAQIEQLTQQLASLKTELEKTKSDHESHIKQLKDTHSEEKQELIEKYDAKISTKEDQLNKLISQSVAASGVNELAIKQHEADIRRVRKEEREKSSQFHKKKIAELTKQLNSEIDTVGKDEYEQKLKELEVLNQELDEFKLTNDDLRNKIADFEDTNRGQESEIETLTDNLNEKIEELQHLEDDLDELKSKHEAEFNKLKDEHDDLVVDMSDLTIEYNELQDEHEKIKVELAEKLNELATVTKINETKAAVLSDTITRLKAKGEEYDSLKESSDKLIEEYKTEVTTLKNEINEVKAELEIATKKESDQNKEITELKASIESTKEEYETKLKESSNSDDFEELETKYKLLQQEFDTLTSTHEENLSIKEKELSDIKAEIKQLQDEIKQKDTQIDSLKADSQEKVNQLFNQFLKIKGIAAPQDENKDDGDHDKNKEFDIYKKFAMNIDSINSRFHEFEAQVVTKEQELEEVNTALDKFKHDLISIKSENETKSNEIKTLSERKEELLKDIEDRDEQISKLESSVKHDPISEQLLNHLSHNDNDVKEVSADSSMIKSPSSELSID